MPVISRIAANAARAFGMFAVSVAKDLYFKYVTLLLPGNGTNGAQNNTFLDSSSNAFTITRNGNTTQGTFTPFSQTGWSNYFDGVSDTLTLTTSSSLSLTGAFTIEFWIYLNSTALDTIHPSIITFPTQPNAYQVYINSTNTYFALYNGAADVVKTANGTATLNQWNHIAISRDSSNNLSIFLNGTRSATTASGSGTIGTSTGTFRLMSYNGTTGDVNGYLSNLRIVNGTAVYDPTQTTLTVPTSPLTAITNTSLLTCQSNRFIDNSSNAFAITVGGDVSVQAFSPFAPTAAYSASTVGGSGYFDGSGDYLTCPDNVAFTFGTGDFSVECWYYPTSSARQIVVSQTNAAGNTYSFILEKNVSNQLRVLSTVGGTQYAAVATATMPLNAWSFLQLVKSGTTLYGYQNGVQVCSVAVGSGSVLDSTDVVDIGGGTVSLPVTGYISDVRILKGTASSATTPTAPLTAITNTSLLLNFTNGGITDATAKNDLETVGNAQISTTQSKWGGSSIAFDGTDDRLTNNNYVNQNLVMGTGDFTIEGWFYTASPATNRGLFQISTTAGGLEAGNTNNIAVYCSSSVLGVYYNDTFKAGTTSISSSTWTHFALVRNSGTTKLYVNGTADSGFGSNADTRNYTGGYIVVGGYFSTSFLWNGYIDDLRITKGYARYTANFTAPTAPFPLQ